MTRINYRAVDVDGTKIFYRQAGPKDTVTILLLHGFPSASHMFRDLIPVLGERSRSSLRISPALDSPTCRHAIGSRTLLIMSRT